VAIQGALTQMRGPDHVAMMKSDPSAMNQRCSDNPIFCDMAHDSTEFVRRDGKHRLTLLVVTPVVRSARYFNAVRSRYSAAP
jgi:hypothetical protein